LAHRQACEYARLANRRAEAGSAALAADPSCVEIFVDEGFELVVRRHLVPFAAFS